MTLLSDGRTVTERLGAARLSSRDITELIGVCKGVLADGVVNPQEALFILNWLEDHRTVVDKWPADILYTTLDDFLEDGRLTSDEERDLVGLLVEITGVPIKVSMNDYYSNSGLEVPRHERTLNTPTSLPIHEPPDGIRFEGMNFVLTGNFSLGPRRICEQAVLEAGGITQKGVTKKTNYLVVGEVGSEAWAHSSFGRKIEKAVYLRGAGHEIFIVSEPIWRASMGPKK